MPGRTGLMFLLVLAAAAPAMAQDNVPGVIARFRAKDPRVAKAFDEAYGYVVFPTVGKGGIGIGGARGKGWGYDDFTRGNFEFDAQVSAIAVTARAAGDLPYRKGVAVVTMGKGGLMYEASVGGQKFSYTPGDR